LQRNQPYFVAGQSIGPAGAMLLAVALVAICYLFSAVVVNLLFGLFGYNDWGTMMASASGRMLYRTTSGISGLLSWGLPAVLWAVYMGGFRTRLGLELRASVGHRLLAFWIPIFLLPVVSSLIIPKDWGLLPEGLDGVRQWAEGQEQRVNSILVSLLSESGWLVFVMNVVSVAVIPAIAEEFLFRGVLLDVLRRTMPDWAAVWLSAAVFSLVHFQFYGFFARMALGVIFGHMYLHTGDLRCSIWAHFAHNFFSLTLVMLVSSGFLPQSFLQGRLEFGWVITLSASLVAFALLYVYFLRISPLKSLQVDE